MFSKNLLYRMDINKVRRLMIFVEVLFGLMILIYMYSVDVVILVMIKINV